MGLFDRLFGKNPQSSLLDGIEFILEGFEFQGRDESMMVWETPDGDCLSICAFSIPPDLPQGFRRSSDYRAFYEKMLGDSGASLVEIKLAEAASVPALWTLVKVPQNPSGMSYVASVTIPYRDFRFVLKVQCAEHGMTGVREALLGDRLLSAGVIEVDDDGNITGN
jgi:hypothetical protein